MLEKREKRISVIIKDNVLEYLILGFILILLFIIRLFQYLLFHTIAELFAIIISISIFIIGWNSRAYMKTSFFLIIGTAFLFIGILDLIHTLAYSGMNIFTGYDTNLATSLWIVARYWQAISLLLSLLLFKKKINLNYLIIFQFFFLIILLIVIFNGIFPETFIEGFGLTPFKVISEYVIDIFFIISLLWLYILRIEFEKRVFIYLIISTIFMILSELMFTLYTDPYGLPNLIGHLFKIVAFYHIYKAIIKTGIKEPYNLLFRTLKLHEKELEIRAEKLEDMASFPLENPNPVLRVNGTHILTANKASQEIFNIKEGDLIPTILQNFVDECFNNSKNRELEINWGDLVFTLFRMTNKAKGYVNIYGLDITEKIKAKQRLERFVATVSHELRNPISVLVTSSDFLESSSEDLTEDIIQKLRNGMKKNIYLLKDLVDDILMLSKIDDRKIILEWKKVKPFEIIQEILLLMQPIGNKKNIRFKVNIDPHLTINADSKRLDQIFRIFIDNAIKYSAKDSIVKIQAIDSYRGHLNKQNIDGVLFIIEDTGIGIAEQDLPHLFERFFRSDKVSDIPGTGLGLSIAKELIELHSGSIEVESKLMKGTKISIFLPTINRI
jgi:signal transduction histidine kinase